MQSPILLRKSFSRSLEGAIAAERWLCALGAEGEMAGQILFAMQVCLEEHFANIVRHGDPGKPAGSEVGIAIERVPGAIRMTVEDDGPEFDITKAGVSPIAGSLQEIEPGGLGLLLIKTFSSSVTYRRDHGRNRLTAEFAA